MAGVDLSDQLLSYALPSQDSENEMVEKAGISSPHTCIHPSTHIIQQIQETTWLKNLETREVSPQPLLLTGSKRKHWATCPAGGTCSSK